MADSLARIYQQANLTDSVKFKLLTGLSFNETIDLKKGYDIITNEHSGQLNVESKEGEYAEFIIDLPNKK